MRFRQFERTVLQSVQLDSQIRLEIAVPIEVVPIVTWFLLDSKEIQHWPTANVPWASPSPIHHGGSGDPDG